MTVIFEVKYESFWFDIGPVVQTGRILALHARGPGFKSQRVHHYLFTDHFRISTSKMDLNIIDLAKLLWQVMKPQ